MKHTIPTHTLITFIALASTTAAAHDHPDGLGGEMKHIAITFDGTALAAHVDPDVPTPQLRDLLPAGHTYSGSYSVLNGTAHNAQYGWSAGGFIQLPAQSGIFVRLVDQTPGLRTYAAMTMAPLFGTDGASDTWQWTGSMVHNWYAIDLGEVAMLPMPVAATYELYIGSINSLDFATPLDGYDPATVRLDFAAIPEPSGIAALLGLSLAIGSRRRRPVRCIIPA